MWNLGTDLEKNAGVSKMDINCLPHFCSVRTYLGWIEGWTSLGTRLNMCETEDGSE